MKDAASGISRQRSSALLRYADSSKSAGNGASWCPQCSNGCCHLSFKLSLSVESSFCRKRAVTRTRRCAMNPNSLSGGILFRLLSRLAVTQRFVYFPVHP